jgi:hypothetical protein
MMPMMDEIFTHCSFFTFSVKEFLISECLGACKMGEHHQQKFKKHTRFTLLVRFELLYGPLVREEYARDHN